MWFQHDLVRSNKQFQDLYVQYMLKYQKERQGAMSYNEQMYQLLLGLCQGLRKELMENGVQIERVFQTKKNYR